MKIEVISCYYREHYLAPLFMRHYENWVDRITLITTRWQDDKLDDQSKMDEINATINRSTADWVIAVDFDEFVFPKNGKDPRTVLEQESGSICQCEMMRVWRHAGDTDVRRFEPPLPQRRHGQPDHIKPCIFRPDGVKIGIGTHFATFPERYNWGEPWGAVHWANADPEFGINRTHEDRQTRLSDRNLAKHWGIIPEWKDLNYLRRLYEKHLNDPLVV